MPGPFGPRKQISAGALNRVAEQGRRLERITGGGVSSIRNTPAGASVYTEKPPGFWAKINDSDDSGTHVAYGWIEQIDDGEGGWVDKPDAMEGTVDAHQAYEINDVVVDPADTPIVWLFPSTANETFLFEVGGAGSPEEICMPMAAGIASGARLYYPCVFVRLDVAADTWTEGPFGSGTYDCFLVQVGRRTSAGYALTVTSPEGPGRYSGIKQSGTKTLGGNTLPVYATVDGPYLGPDCQVRN